MNRYETLAIYAFLIMVIGVILISFSFYPTLSMHFIIGFGMLFSSIFAYLTAYKSKNLQIPLKYHGLHALSMSLYGIMILFYGNQIDLFLIITIYFLLFYGIAEIIFSLQILLLRIQNIKLTIVASRLGVGFFIATGAILVLATSSLNQNNAIMFAGFVFIFIGFNTIIFKTVLKRLGEPA
ncbi:MAG: hypothetical protein ABI851_05340 [Saprospiraceae bacterium]